ncbi:hypothetical protein FS749_014135 [Ceratobasidium sp. UAMH 11750]|nr:hypothetical protein FS749_014135 [Ceratobasidium sp. UAMH 11750]
MECTRKHPGAGSLWVAESLTEKPPRKEAVKSARERRREGEVEGKMEGSGMVKRRKDGDELSAEAGFICLGSWLKLAQTSLKHHVRRAAPICAEENNLSGTRYT